MRRLVVQIQLRSRAENELRTINDRLESVVEERTSELLATNRQLSRLIDEQRCTADSLRRTNRFVENVFQQAPCLILTFDANSRQCGSVNGRITNLLGYAVDDIAVTASDFIDRLVWSGDRARLLAAIKAVSSAPEGAVECGTCGFATAAGKRVDLTFGVTVLDRTPDLQAKNLLLTATPATA